MERDGAFNPEAFRNLLERDVKSRLSILNSILLKLKEGLTHEDIDNSITPALKHIGVTVTFSSFDKNIYQEKYVNKLSPKAPRLPYRQYTSSDDIIICVGRSAKDNDILSCDEHYRDDRHWWLHASGCPGSHVVIRSQENDLPARYPTTLLEAALLAAKHSKCASHKCTVTVTRCKEVNKFPGAADGQVALGKIHSSVHVDLRGGTTRLQALAAQLHVDK